MYYSIISRWIRGMGLFAPFPFLSDVQEIVGDKATVGAEVRCWTLESKFSLVSRLA
jgi:hypothetical protein